MSDQVEIENPSSAAEEDFYHKPARLVRISLWASTISWVILVLTVLTVGVNVYYLALNGLSSFNFTTVLNLLYSLGIGVFFFLTLQAVSEGIYLLMDILDGVRASGRRL